MDGFTLRYAPQRGEWEAWVLPDDARRQNSVFGKTAKEAADALMVQEGRELNPWNYIDREAYETGRRLAMPPAMVKFDESGAVRVVENGRRTSRRIASRTSRPLGGSRASRRVWPNGKRASKGSELRRIEDAAREAGWSVERTKSGHLMFRSPDKLTPPLYSIGKESDPHSIRNTEAMLRRHGLETRESRRVKKNALDEPEWIESFTIGGGLSAIIYKWNDGRARPFEARIIDNDHISVKRTLAFSTHEDARRSARLYVTASGMASNPLKPGDKRLLKMLEEQCGPAQEWGGRCTEIARRASELVGHPDVYGHYRGPVHAGGFWGSRKGHGFIQHGWVKLPTGKVLDPTRFSFEHKDPYIHVGPERPEYDEGGQIFRAQRIGAPPGRREEPTRPVTLSFVLTPEAARSVELIFGPEEVELHDVNGTVTMTVRQALYLANSSYESLQPFTREIYQALAKADLRGFVPMDNWQRAEREAGPPKKRTGRQ
jgi:hypothetical protein